MGCCGGVAGAGTLRPRSVTVDDGIEMNTLANPDYVDGGGPECDVASYSPDGNRFLVVIRRGDIARDVNHYTILLWNARNLSSEQPRSVLQLNSSSIRPAIDPRTISWAPEGHSVTFLGEHAQGHHEVFRLNIDTGELQQLTSHPTSIVSYSVATNEAFVAYTANPPFRSLWDAEARRRGLLVTTQYLPDLITGRKGYEFRGRSSETELFIKTPGDTRRVPLDGHVPADVLFGPWISPNGKYVVIAETVPVRQVPRAWRQYRNWVVQYWFSVARRSSSGMEPQALSWLERYVLVDSRTGKTRILLDSPVFAPGKVVWSPDSSSVVLSDVLAPIAAHSSGAGIKQASRSTTLEVGLRRGTVRVVGRRCYNAREWRGDELICDGEPSLLERAVMQLTSKKTRSDVAEGCLVPRRLRFRKIDGEWRDLGDAVQANDIVVSVKESINSAPEIYWRESGSKDSHLLYDLNPKFGRSELGRVQVVTWGLSDGRRISGDLYYPPHYRSGQRYPLVIQTHGWSSERFMFFGAFPTAFAAQPLAARNMMVLQVGDIQLPEEYGKHGQLREVEAAVEVYRSAIKYLSKRGLIDPSRVGIIGFSHTCFYVKWALAHYPELFAAASVNEGEDGGYLQYITDFNEYVDAPSLYGGPPFGPYLNTWMKLSPGFNLQRVRAPLLITVLNPRFVLDDWEWFQGLRDLRKPVQMLMLDGEAHEEHLLETPRDRALSAGATTDWFDFWLNGHEDPTQTTDLQLRQLCELYQSESGHRARCNSPG